MLLGFARLFLVVQCVVFRQGSQVCSRRRMGKRSNLIARLEHGLLQCQRFSTVFEYWILGIPRSALFCNFWSLQNRPRLVGLLMSRTLQCLFDSCFRLAIAQNFVQDCRCVRRLYRVFFKEIHQILWSLFPSDSRRFILHSFCLLGSWADNVVLRDSMVLINRLIELSSLVIWIIQDSRFRRSRASRRHQSRASQSRRSGTSRLRRSRASHSRGSTASCLPRRSAFRSTRTTSEFSAWGIKCWCHRKKKFGIGSFITLRIDSLTSVLFNLFLDDNNRHRFEILVNFDYFFRIGFINFDNFFRIGVFCFKYNW
mmetsp:Transcript_21916/g.54251  ORF Transcript_21916/g.54251 Transcript_21916/m.54251 type:complete len:312 (-) Transcript_21916:463-1398(-)